MRHIDRRVVYAVVLFSFLEFFPRTSFAFAPFGRDAFRRISFSSGCRHHEWSLTTDDALELMLSPSAGRPCEALLEFQTPLPVEDANGLSFNMRRTGPRAGLIVSVDDGRRQVDSPRFRVYKTWQDDGLLFHHMRDNWAPERIVGFKLTALPPAQDGNFSVYIRDFRLVKNTPRAHRDSEDETKTPATAPIVPPSTVDLAPTPTPMPLPAKSGRLQTAILAFSLFMLCAAALAEALKRRKQPKRRGFSPLYELNMRTWKSHRDADGVLHVGGFASLTTADLRGIKSAGFNSLWLMGIWEIGPRVREMSRRYGADYEGSPFAIHDYAVSEELGSEDDFNALIKRAHDAKLRVIIDFIPNHMGIDSAWLNDHPEYFIHRVLGPDEGKLSDQELKERYPAHFVYRTPSYPIGAVRVPKTILVALGNDPYFHPWIDTAQLDYAEPALRRKMIDVLCYWARRVDGIRADMAMLVLRDQVKAHRHPDMDWDAFSRRMPEEFWPEAIRTVKRENPSFLFIAETYWAMEGFLQNLGFDYTYNKPVYEALCNAFHIGHAEGLMNFLRLLGPDFLSRSVHFLENHDEERAMNALGEEKQRAAAAVLTTLPGIVLIHQGQMEGRRERLPVQRVVPLQPEPSNTALLTYYRRLLTATARPLFRTGQMRVLYSNNAAFICYARLLEGDYAIVVVNASGELQKGTIFFPPGFGIKTGQSYMLEDLYFPLKHPEVRRQPTVQSFYVYPAAQLIMDGLYVELHPYDAHIFLMTPTTVAAAKPAKTRGRKSSLQPR